MIYRLKGALHDGRVLQLQPMRGVEHEPRCRRHCLRSSLSQRNKVSESSTFFKPHQRIEIIRDKGNIASTDLLPGIASRRAGTPQTTRRKEDNCAK